MQITNPVLTTNYMARMLTKPITAFITDIVKQKPGKCIVKDVVIFLRENAGLITCQERYVEDAEAHFGNHDNNKKLYYSYANPHTAIYGLPDLFYNTSPKMAIYYCEHKDFRKHQFNKTNPDLVGEINNIVTDETVFLAEGLLLLQSAIYFCENSGYVKGLLCLACNLNMLSYLHPFILNPDDKYPILEIADISVLPYVEHYLQTNGFTEMPLEQTHLKARIYSKCIVEADDTVLLFLGWG